MADDFVLLPADGPDILPDDELAAALDARDAANANQEPQPYGRGWAFDFTGTRDFVKHGQGPARARGIENLKVWIEKTLRTARFAHVIYGDDYGIDTVELIGRPLSPELVGQYGTAVTAALLVHDRISSVEDFAFSADPGTDLLEVTFTVVVDEGDESLTITAALNTGGS